MGPVALSARVWRGAHQGGEGNRHALTPATTSYPGIVSATAELHCRSAILDGKVNSPWGEHLERKHSVMRDGSQALAWGWNFQSRWP